MPEPLTSKEFCLNPAASFQPKIRKTNLSDEELVERCLAGDQASWELLVYRYQSLIYSIPINRGLPGQDAADIFQNVCVLLLQNLKTLRSVKALSTWIYVTTQRECSRLARTRKRFVSLEGQQEQKVDFAEPETDEKVRLQHEIQRGLDHLPPKCRELLLSLYFAEPSLSYEEVAKKMKFPMGSIGPTRARCLECLKKAMIQGQSGHKKRIWKKQAQA